MLRSLVITFALLSIFSGLLRAEVRTLTDQFGRSITADVLELDGDTLKIRRDDGIVFDLPIGNLSIEDQKSLRQWAARQPKKVEPKFEPNPKLLPLSYSRVKLKTETLSQYGSYYKYVSEHWGYSIQITNKELRTIDGLRAEYNLFANNPYYVAKESPIVGVLKFDPLRTNETGNLKTRGVEIRKEKSTYWGNSGGDVNGIWIRVYYNDTLVHEVTSPENLRETESWRKVKD
ncbi:MAG: hypothetical protein ABII82_11075 [Verrucomicrobiota bacterium]